MVFDTDFDHPMESVLMGHPERVMPFCVKHFRVYDGVGRMVQEVSNNHETQRDFTFDPPLTTDTLKVEIVGVHGNAPTAVFSMRCYA